MPFVVVEEGENYAVVVEAPQENIAVALNAGPTQVTIGTGITSINSLTAQTQTLAVNDETNVTLDIVSSGSTHTVTPGWQSTLSVARGGTGSGTSAGARGNLGAAASGANSDITSISGLTTPLSIPQGGTGQTSANAALNALLPSQTGQGGKVLQTDGTNTSWQASSSYTDEQAQDAVGTILVDTSTIDFTYDDATPQITASVKNDSVTFDILQNISTGRVLGRTTAASGNVEELSAGAGITLSGGQISSSITQYTDELAQDATGTILVDTATIDFTYDDVTPQITADVKDNSITFAKIQDITDARLLGRSAGSAGDMQELTVGAPITLSGGVLDFDETAALGNNARVAVNKNSGATVGTRRRINFIEGSNVTLTIADDAGNEEVDVTIAASGGGGTPGGADTQLQYNNGGAFGGISLSNWDDVNNDLTLGSYSGTGEFITIQSSNAAATALKIDSATGTGAYVLTGASGTSYKSETTGGKAFTGLSNDGGTANAVELISLTHNSTGTPAAGLGVRIGLYAETSTTADTPQAYLESAWIVATHATRQGRLSIYLNRSGDPVEHFRFTPESAVQSYSCIAVIPGGNGLVLSPSGSGFIASDKPDSSTSGGNVRGTYSTDWQRDRNNASEVASGTGATIVGGLRNTASGNFSVAGGDGNVASGTYALASGLNSTANKYGQEARASGAFAANGDAQTSVFTVRAATTDATANVELFLDGAGAAQRMTIAANTAWMFKALVIGSQQNSAGTHSVELTGVIKRDNANNTTLVYVNAENANGAGTATAQADDTNEALKIVVTGVAATNIRWVARVEIVEVTYP